MEYVEKTGRQRERQRRRGYTAKKGRLQTRGERDREDNVWISEKEEQKP